LGTFGSVRGGLSISQGTNIVTLPFRKREETGNTKLFLKLRDVHLLDFPLKELTLRDNSEIDKDIKIVYTLLHGAGNMPR